MSQNTLIVGLWTLALSVSAMAQRSSNFVSFDVPGARSTTAQGINNNGEVVGTFVDADGKQHGFLLRGGNFTTIDYPNAVATVARGINANGDIIGSHTGPNASTPLSGGDVHGFLLRAGSSVPEALDYPGHMNTIPQRISDDGQVIGCYHDQDTMETMHGMLASNGNFIALDGSQFGIDLPASMSNGLTPDGKVVTGLYTDMMSGFNYGYIASNGTVASFRFPFSISSSVWDMNASGEIVGQYMDSAKKQHGFLLSVGDAITTFGANLSGVNGSSFAFQSVDFPGASSTSAFGISPRGDVVGNYVDAAGKTHAYLWTRGRRRAD